MDVTCGSRVAWNIRSYLENGYNCVMEGETSPKVKERRLKLSGYCVCHPEEEDSKLLWQPTERGIQQRQALTCIDCSRRDTGLDSADRDNLEKHCQYSSE